MKTFIEIVLYILCIMLMIPGIIFLAKWWGFCDIMIDRWMP